MSPAPTDPQNRRRLVALIAAGIVLLLLASVGVYGLLAGPRTSTDPDSEPGPVATAPPSVAPSTPRPPRVPAVPRSADPETFAQGVASTLFAWDTASGLWPLDYTSAILTVGDPTGDEQAGLASDVAAYLPTRDAWIELRQYATRQHLTIDTAYVPNAWADAVGTTAVTIEGTRHRAGVWNGQPVTSEHPVAFTVFVVCAPTYPTCHLLRLSQLDNPLR
ncbi:hypothetical protein M3G03_12585 [Aestuariimicrobium sp. p3-SID1156]|uniref:hypothetical protein n=1 Tax=Aestuariimicrobium sp. p3-SID1156 TaxID=2916038 RepID=UPI00223B4F44|nr:hypothetical protein [Aestuariimicrobium sp. p3-SID1156]MCT1460366.1 hypothetical protein [Aestuariimicrobium sp. p3-SID1156]